MPVRISPQDFVHKWKRSTLGERSGYQAHFLDLCSLLGQAKPSDVDPHGEWYAFEKRVEKLGGGKGFADVWRRGSFVWEYKGRNAQLSPAYEQLLRYRESLENPPLLVVCNFDTIQIHTNFTNTVKETYTLSLDDLLDASKLDQLRAVFTEPESLRTAPTTAAVTESAAREFARLSLQLQGREEISAPRAAHFLIRILFCLFAEDIRLLPKGLFTRLVVNLRNQPEVFASSLRQLFGAMATGGMFGEHRIPHFNGGLFNDNEVIQLDRKALDILADVCTLDWSSVEPAILGTLFERSLDPAKRSQLGAHYTSREDILLVVEGVLMAPLYEEWHRVKQEARELVDRRNNSKDSRQRSRIEGRLKRLLQGFQSKVASTRVLDPACGSGNFLYVALRELLALEKDVAVFAGDADLTRFLPSVSPTQLYGIEVNEYARELAQATVWIGYIQWLRENGFGEPDEPFLKPLENISLMDSILQCDAVGNPSEPMWPDAEVIIGNPPFLGGNKVRQELGNDYVEALFRVYKDKVPAFSDLVCYFFERARAQVSEGKTQRVGLLATQGIRGGANRKVLQRIKQTGEIFWAISDRDWVLEGAHVHVSMVGFDGGTQADRQLDGRLVSEINANLTSATDLTTAQVLAENVGICFMGPSPKGPFDIDAVTAEKMLHAPLNVNGRPNSDVVRPVVSAVDLVGQSREKWTIDFALMPLEQAARYELPFRYVKQHVYPVRAGNRRAAYAEKWWQYAEARPGMRRALVGKSRFVATPGVARHRLFVWMDQQVLCNQGTLVFAREDDYFFGVLHSRPHELWARATGTQLREAKSGFRYTPTSTFDTYPLPWAPGSEPIGDPLKGNVATAALELTEERGRWLNADVSRESQFRTRTLTNLYNDSPDWLTLLHHKLDCAVLDAYDWPRNLSDVEILDRLLALNRQRAAGTDPKDAAKGEQGVATGVGQVLVVGPNADSTPYASG